MGRLSSLSILRTCWLCAIILIFDVVGRCTNLNIPSVWIDRLWMVCKSLSPFSSCPIAPQRWTSQPNATRLLATLAAPPRARVSDRVSRMGTGASGDIRLIPPHIYSSSIRSPTTKILGRFFWSKNFLKRSLI